MSYKQPVVTQRGQNPKASGHHLRMPLEAGLGLTGPPELDTLLVVGHAHAVVAVRLAVGAGRAVQQVHVGRAVGRGTRAVFGEVTGSCCLPAGRPSHLQLPREEREASAPKKSKRDFFFFSIRDTPEDTNLCTFGHKPPRLAPGGLILVQSMVPRGPYLTAWSREGLGGVTKRGGYPAVLAAVAVGTLGPHLQRAVVRVAAGVGALLRGEMETASPRGLSPPLPFPSLLLAPSPPLTAPPLGLSPFGTTQAPREDPSPCHVEGIGAAHPAPYLHLPAVTVLSVLQKAVATLAAHHQVLGVGQVEETHASSLLEVVLQLPLAAGAEDAREGVAAQGTDGEGWEPGRSGPGEGGKPQSELGNKDTGELAQTLPGAAAAAALAAGCTNTSISHPNPHR